MRDERPGVLPHYLSTACYHGHHVRCRLVCKFCSEPCLCKCHGLHPPMHIGPGIPASQIPPEPLS